MVSTLTILLWGIKDYPMRTPNWETLEKKRNGCLTQMTIFLCDWGIILSTIRQLMKLWCWGDLWLSFQEIPFLDGRSVWGSGLVTVSWGMGAGGRSGFWRIRKHGKLYPVSQHFDTHLQQNIIFQCSERKHLFWGNKPRLCRLLTLGGTSQLVWPL